jgi:hypothetical protein
MRIALLAVSTVWVLGCIWSYQEQSAFAASKGFTFPHLLPLVIDGFAVSMAGVSWAASLDARPAIPARLATVVAVAASSASNGVWAYLRANHDVVTVVLGTAVPVAANMAFEVLLAELRRQVQRRRGLPPPVAVPYPRLIRMVLAPWQTFRTWRTLVLEITALEHTVAAPPPAPSAAQPDPEPRYIEQPVTRGTTAAARNMAAPPRTRVPSSVPTRGTPAARDNAVPVFSAPAATPVQRPRRAPQPSTQRVQPATPATAEPVAAAEPVAPVPPAAPEPTGQPEPAWSREPVEDQIPAAASARSVPGPSSNGSSANGSSSRVTSRSNGSQRPPDPRVAQLAQHLATAENADEFTGEMVGPLLNIDVAPRTGRRLLGQARELLSRRAEAEMDGLDQELSVIGGR